MRPIFFSLLVFAPFLVGADEVSSEFYVTVKFAKESHAEEYLTWMSEQGEQDIRIWMQEAEPELDKFPVYDLENRIIDYSQPKD